MMNIFQRKKRTEGDRYYDKGQTLYIRMKYEKAFAKFEFAAKNFHHAKALYKIGYMYEFGEGKRIDYEQAFISYNQAAIIGDDKAQFRIGSFYYYGKGVAPDYEEAFKWYQKAAIQGYSVAQGNLGLLYYKGEGVAVDYSEAFNWTKKAADQGEIVAQSNLGHFYHLGKGVTLDYKEAIRWFKKAADQGSDIGQSNLGEMYRNGKGVPVDFKEALRLFQKAADQGDNRGQCNLGIMYQKGQGVITDYKEALKWFKKAAYQGDSEAQYNLGVIYQTGQGVTIDQKKAFHWFQKAAIENDYDTENKVTQAKYKVACAYKNGLGVSKDPEQALRWYKESAEDSYNAAQLELGIIYLNGFGVNKNLTQAFYWLTKAEHLEQSKLCLGYLYEKGLGMEQDSKKAKEYFDSKFTNGIQSAMYDLGMTYLKIDGGRESFTQALYWFEKAAQEDHVESLLAIGSIYLIGSLDGKRDVVKAYSYLSRAAKLEQVNLELDLLKQFQDFEVEGEEYKDVIKRYIKCKGSDRIIEKGCVSGLSCLGFLYHKGIGVRQDFGKAHELYNKILQNIDCDNSDANMCLGLLYLKGLGVDQDYQKAMEFFEKSAESINTYTYNIIGDIYSYGHGVEKNTAKAMEWYMKGAKLEDEYSQFNVGKIYLDTLGLEAGGEAALNWFRKSYANGCRKAQEYIKRLDCNNNLTAVSSYTKRKNSKKSYQFFQLDPPLPPENNAGTNNEDGCVTTKVSILTNESYREQQDLLNEGKSTEETMNDLSILIIYDSQELPISYERKQNKSCVEKPNKP